MKSFGRLSLALAAAVTLTAAAGCSQVPVAGTYPVSYQHKMQSVRHWQTLAQDVTARVREQVAVDPILAAKPLYIRPQARDTSFNDGFHDLLLTEMLNAGLPVATTPEGAHQLHYDTELLRHAAAPVNRPTPGAITGLAAALLAPSLVAEDTFTTTQAGLTGLGLAGAADLGIGGLSRETDTEMVFTVAIWDDGILRFREQEIFYVPGRDRTLYAGKPPVEEQPLEIVF